MKEYSYLPQLTGRLDGLAGLDFDQSLVNEIVLWKLNRHVRLSRKTLNSLNGLKDLDTGKHREGESVITSLLSERGVGLGVASTLLRFKNPRAFQIIDRHAYRALKGADYPVKPSWSIREQINVYFEYLDGLVALSTSKDVDFQMLDRLLYVFDKKFNGKLQRQTRRPKG